MKKFISFLLAAAMSVSIISAEIPAGAEENVQQYEGTSMNSNMSVEGTNSFGSLLTDEINTEMDEQQENNGFNIFSVEMLGTEATVSLESLEDSTVVVGIYDESGQQLIASGSAEVAKGETEKTVTIETDSMPEYFYIKAYLVDDNLRPVCTVYESPNYTQEMQEFFAKTVNDFDSEKVLNLDEDETNNFAVYNDSVKIIPQQSGVNTVKSVDDESSVYVIENADENFTSLKAGDVFSYTYRENELLIVKIGDISVDGTTVTITGTETSLQEIFDYVKIDESVDAGEAIVNDSICDEGVTYEGIVEGETEQENQGSQVKAWDKEGSLTLPELSFSLNCKYKEGSWEITISGSTNMQYVANIKAYITKSYHYFEFSIDYTVKNSLSIQTKNENKVAIANDTVGEINTKLAEITKSIVPGVTLTFTPELFLEASGKCEFNQTLTGTSGFVSDSGNGCRDISTSPYMAKSEMKTEVTIYAGLSLNLNLTVINKNIGTFKLTGKFGAEIKAALKFPIKFDVNSFPSKKHECVGCIDGDVSAKIKVYFEVTLGPNWFVGKLDIAEKSWKIWDFYYSIDYNEFGFTECPHDLYLTTVSFKASDAPIKNSYMEITMIKDAEGKAVSGSDVFNKYYSFDSDGKQEVYLPNGTYSITAQKTGDENYKCSKELTVHNSAQELNINLAEYTITVNDEEDNAVNRAHVRIIPIKDKNGNDVAAKEATGIYDYTDENGKLFVCLENGTYKITADKSNVGRGSMEIVVINKEREVNIKLKKSTVEGPKFSVGGAHAGAIDENGDLYMWGNNVYGQLGYFPNIYSSTPGPDACYSPIQPHKRISLGSTVSIHNAKAVYCQGDKTAVIDEYGDLYIWSGGKSNTNDNYPCRVSGLEYVKSVSFGLNHSAAITEDGTLYMWGDNSHGNLGNGTYEDSYVPIKVMGNVKTVCCEGNSTAAITNDGSLYIWGDIAWHISGDNSPIEILKNVKTVSMDIYCLAAVTEDGGLYMLGTGVMDFTKIDPETGNRLQGYYYTSKTPVKIMDGVNDIELEHVNGLCVGAIVKDGDLYMWGFNNYGQLGNGTTTDSWTPIKVMEGVASISYEDETIGVIKNDGSMYIWGNNKSGKLGVGKSDSKLTYLETPVKVELPAQYGFDYPGKYDDETAEETNSGAQTNSFSALKSMKSIRKIVAVEAEALTEIDTAAETKSFTELTPNEIYNFYVLKSGDVENLLSADNLLYISQGVSDSEGNLSMTYIPEEQYDDAYIFVKGMNENILKDENVNISDLMYNGFAQYIQPEVTYNGVTLIEGVDYEISGDYCASESGTYTLTITGIGDYSGTVKKGYAIVCEHVYEDGVCTICGAVQGILTDKNISIPEMQCSSSPQNVQPEVTYNGKILTEGVDYEISGDLSVESPGTYSVTITGIGDYSGTVEKEYTVAEHVYEDGVCTICGEPQTVLGDANGDGILNVRDAAFIAQKLAKGKKEELPDCADYNEDGFVNVRDAAAIAKFLAKKTA